MQRFRVSYDNNRVSEVEFFWGLEERPLWKTLEKLPANVAIKWVDRFSPFEAVAAEWALAIAFETAFKIKIPERALYLRCIYLEVQRILWAFNYACRLFTAMDDQIRYQKSLRLREMVFEVQEVLSGNRVLPQILKLGGVERDLSVGEGKKLRGSIQQIGQLFNTLLGDVENDQSISARLIGVLPISKELISELKLDGCLGHASGLATDLRHKFEPTKVVPFKDVRKVGDALSRLQSVFFQVRQSLDLLTKLSADLPSGAFEVELNEVAELPAGSWTGAIESGPGPLYASLRRGEIRIGSHSTRLMTSIHKLVVGLDGDDFELSLASLYLDFEQADLCGRV